MVGLRIEGGQELARNLNALPARVSRRIMNEALRDAAEPMRARMAALAPREPGAPDLADNIVVSVAQRIGSTEGGAWRPRFDDKEAAVAVGPAKNYFYGLMQEFGTVRHGAQPFARPAFSSEASKALSILTAALWTAIAGRGGIQIGTSNVPVSGPGRLT